MTSPIVDNEITHDYFPLLRVYKTGELQRFAATTPASLDPSTGVQSKDIIISPGKTSARLYLPKTITPVQKLPLLVYFHGGAFIADSASSSMYHTHLNTLVSKSNLIAVSVDYRLAPEHHLPIAYDDCWESLEWVLSKSDSWLKDHADYDHVFFGGDSAGANIAHNMAIRVGLSDLKFILDGMLLMCPYFGGVEPVGGEVEKVEAKKLTDRLWGFANPGSSGLDDPLFNPELDPDLEKLGCKRVFVMVAEKDILRDRGWNYCQVLGKSGWGGEVEFMEVNGENHVFYLLNPTLEKAPSVMQKMISFINKNRE